MRGRKEERKLDLTPMNWGACNQNIFIDSPYVYNRGKGLMGSFLAYETQGTSQQINASVTNLSFSLFSSFCFCFSPFCFLLC